MNGWRKGGWKEEKERREWASSEGKSRGKGKKKVRGGKNEEEIKNSFSKLPIYNH